MIRFASRRRGCPGSGLGQGLSVFWSRQGKGIIARANDSVPDDPDGRDHSCQWLPEHQRAWLRPSVSSLIPRIASTVAEYWRCRSGSSVPVRAKINLTGDQVCSARARTRGDATTGLASFASRLATPPTTPAAQLSSAALLGD